MDAIAVRSIGGAENQGLHPSTPRDGDLVVVDARNEGGYGVRQIPGTVQFHMPQREGAVGFARDFARRHAVDVWCYNEHGGYRLLEVFRREGGGQGIGRGPRR